MFYIHINLFSQGKYNLKVHTAQKMMYKPIVAWTGDCVGCGDAGSSGDLGLGAGMIFFIRGGCTARLFSLSCH